MKHLNKLFLSK